jgi:hypothetical protein
MKKYRCIFTYANGHTSLEVNAADAQGAAKQARETVSDGDATSLDVFDSSGLVLTVDPKTRRADGRL